MRHTTNLFFLLIKQAAVYLVIASIQLSIHTFPHFFIINMCGTGIFRPHWKVDADLETKWLAGFLN